MDFGWFKPHRLPGEPRHALDAVHFGDPTYEGKHGKEGEGSYFADMHPRPGTQVPEGWRSR